MEKSLNINQVTVGMCYYPEQWPKEMWEDDLRRMKSLGVKVVRIAEFAWNQFEPRDGEFQFQLFDEFLELCGQHKMRVIFCTPTATPPIWLTHKYPETLLVTEDGRTAYPGMRRHCTYNSIIYRYYSGRIAEVLAKHYGENPCIIGWQVDNEFNCHFDAFYSESDQIAFRKFLQNKFGTLEKFVEEIGGIFWNQIYTSWDEVFLKRYGASYTSNPHMLLLEKEFFSESCISYCRLQTDILRKYIGKQQFITTNGMFRHLDYHKLTRNTLDFIGYDSYPNFAYDVKENPFDGYKLNDRKWSYNLAKARAVSPNFAILEQQSGASGWNVDMRHPSPKPGQIHLWAMQSVAAGADLISFFRWRTCTFGTEIYCHGFNNYDNHNNWRLKELGKISDSIGKLKNLSGKRYIAEVAVVEDYLNEWDGEDDEWHKDLRKHSQSVWYQELQYAHIPTDIYNVNETYELEEALQNISRYKVLVYPHASIVTEYTAALLKAYVAGGGILVLGCRSGYKERFGKCTEKRLPGLLADLAGSVIVDYTAVGRGDGSIMAEWEEVDMEVPEFNDILEPFGDTAVLAIYKNNYYRGSAALTKNKFGKGKCYYWGGGFGHSCVKKFISELKLEQPYQNLAELPVNVEISVREGDGQAFIFLMNYSSGEEKIKFKEKVYDILSGETVIGEYHMRPYQVIVLDGRKIS